MSRAPWRIAIDRGGTFTDIVAEDADGGVLVRKVPTGAGGNGHDRTLAEVRRIVGADPDAVIPAGVVSSVRYGTTAATNALLTRGGDRSALFVTRGFGDLLRIGNQERPDLFALEVVRPEPLSEVTVEVDERVLADGTVRTPLDEEALRDAARAVVATGVRSAAVLFLHSYGFPAHEQRAGEILVEAGFEHVALSHRVAREIKAVARGRTAAADAYLTPLLFRSFAHFRAAFGPEVDVRFMQSHGGLADLNHANGPAAILSGPAGGVVAVGEIARFTGQAQVVGFDMGGTSTDVCRFAGTLERRYETKAAGLSFQVPSLRVVTVAAGGGSILEFDGRRLRVGPGSAGSRPGPAGYGVGGPATITDANAVLGRLVPDRFPRVFGPGGDEPFDPDKSRAALLPLAQAAGLPLEDAAQGFLDVANERMAQAVREISVARGFDVRDHALVCFGGAAAQHGCEVARALGVRTVLVPPHASVLSAWGIGRARPSVERAAAVLRPLDDAGLSFAAAAAHSLEREARTALLEQRVEEAQVERLIEVRHVGVDATVDVPLTDLPSTAAAFSAAHVSRFGFDKPGEPVEIVNVRVRVTAQGEDRACEARVSGVAGTPGQRMVWFRIDGEVTAVPTPVLDLRQVPVDVEVSGPALLVDDVTTVVVAPGWTLRMEPSGVMRMTLEGAVAEAPAHASDPVALSLFANRFMAIAERMGAVLERTSHSTNIKERLDFSCAVFDGEGRLVANAPHIPVHLGAMGASVRAVAQSRGADLREGDVLLSNDPYHGGSHLPDVTAVTPVLVREGRATFWIANRAHHADVGGVAPGSMPADSRTLADEGVVLHGVLAVRDGRLLEDDLLAALDTGPHPARAPLERLADLRAQAAANAEGARLLTDLVERHGVGIVGAFMGRVLDDGAAAMGELIGSLAGGARVLADELDDGIPVRVRIERDGDRLVVDFTGTGPQSAGNRNAPPAVTRAAVLYALRTLLPREIPLNEGCLRPLELCIPPASLLDPESPAAVVGGNVETSMRVVDLVLGAWGAAAASQGTMNNVAFGLADGHDERRSAYYETICGGTGAGPHFDGASAVQAHMTNTRITDPEVLERRWPVVVRRFQVRRGSGGAGRHRGGDGAVRELEFLAPVRATILSGRRRVAPFGLAGGSPGAVGRNLLLTDGEEIDLGAAAAVGIPTGGVLRIETPGGGGYGGD